MVKHWFKRFALLLGAGLMSAGVMAADVDEGIEYSAITPAQPTDNPAKVEVVEMFWYGCPHCYHLEPELDKWLEDKPADVEFIRVPAVLGPSWELLARAWYTAEFLGLSDKLHKPIFDAIHQEHHKFNGIGDVRSFFIEHGVSGEDFDNTWNSFGVMAKVNRAKQLTRNYGITGVPTLIVNGKYRTSASQTGSNDRMFEVIDHLIGTERKALAGH